MTKTIDWNPAKGLAFQGDVVLMPIPDDIVIDMSDEIAPRDGRLILAEGEVTGHHHAIGIGKYAGTVTEFRDDGLARALDATIATARMYRDPKAVAALVRANLLTTDSLAIGFLLVEGGPMTLRHEEHDAISIPPGRYYVGGQREMDAAAERRVQD